MDTVKYYYRRGRRSLQKRQEFVCLKGLEFANLVGIVLIFEQLTNNSSINVLLIMGGALFAIGVYSFIWYYLGKFNG